MPFCQRYDKISLLQSIHYDKHRNVKILCYPASDFHFSKRCFYTAVCIPNPFDQSKFHQPISIDYSSEIEQSSFHIRKSIPLNLGFRFKVNLFTSASDLSKIPNICLLKLDMIITSKFPSTRKNMVKDKSNVKRVYDEDGFKRRAACVCVRSEEENEVLLISSTKPGVWKIPGGGLDPGEEASEAAAREVAEEAGVLGILGRSLGVFEDAKSKERTEVYVMVVTKEMEKWDESVSRARKRQWFSIEEAMKQVGLYSPFQRNYLQQLRISKVPKNTINLC